MRYCSVMRGETRKPIQPKTCSDCGAPMEAGVMIETMGGPKIGWHPRLRGTPFFKTLFGRPTGTIDAWRPDKFLEITTYRCTACGLLKLHANQAAEPGDGGP